MIIKARKINRYSKIAKNGKRVTVFVMEVFQATAEQLADMQKTLGSNYKVNSETGLPLLYTTTFEGNIAEVVKSSTYVTDPVTKVRTLVPDYKILAGEDLELKRSIYQEATADNSVSIVPVTAAVSVNAAEGISESDSEF